MAVVLRRGLPHLRRACPRWYTRKISLFIPIGNSPKQTIPLGNLKITCVHLNPNWHAGKILGVLQRGWEKCQQRQLAQCKCKGSHSQRENVSQHYHGHGEPSRIGGIDSVKFLLWNNFSFIAGFWSIIFLDRIWMRKQRICWRWPKTLRRMQWNWTISWPAARTGSGLLWLRQA